MFVFGLETSRTFVATTRPRIKTPLNPNIISKNLALAPDSFLIITYKTTISSYFRKKKGGFLFGSAKNPVMKNTEVQKSQE